MMILKFADKELITDEAAGCSLVGPLDWNTVRNSDLSYLSSYYDDQVGRMDIRACLIFSLFAHAVASWSIMSDLSAIPGTHTAK